MRSLEIQNPTLDKTYKTRLGADYSSGVTATVENNNSFSANDLGVFGEPSEELTELKKIDSTSGSTTLTLATALKFSHSKGTNVYKSPWDYVYIERRVTAAAAWAQISESPIQWDNPNNLTIYYDADATDAYGYRWRFYNSVSDKYSEYSPTLTGEGFTRNQVGFMIDNVRLITGDADRKVVTDEELIRFFNRAQDIIYTHNAKYWFLLVDAYKAGLGIACTANNNVYSLSSLTNFGHLASIRFRYNSGGTDEMYPLLKKGTLEFDKLAADLNRTAEDWADFCKLLPADSDSDYGYIQIYPKTKTTGIGTLYPNYYEKMADLNSVDDETQVPLPQLLEDFAIGQVERIKGNESKAVLYEKNLVSEDPRVTPPGLLMLDKLDQNQREVQGQPRSLWNFKGQKGVARMYSGRHYNHDTEADYMD